MIKIKVKRWYNTDCTLSRITVDNAFFCFGLELPNLGNQPNVSCIPEGIYKARKHFSPSNKNCIEILGVPARTHIQIHAGNYTRNILGCLLVGDGIKYLDMDNIPDVTNSGNTLAKVLNHLPNEFEVEIYS
jgi:hypothetical protein